MSDNFLSILLNYYIIKSISYAILRSFWFINNFDRFQYTEFISSMVGNERCGLNRCGAHKNNWDLFVFLIDSDPRAVIIRRTRMEPPAAPEAAATALSPLRKNFHLLVVVLFFFPLLLLLYSCFSLFFSTQFLLDGDISATAAAAVAGAHLHAPPPRWPICKSSDWIVALPPKNRTTDLNEINTTHLHAHRRKRKKTTTSQRQQQQALLPREEHRNSSSITEQWRWMDGGGFTTTACFRFALCSSLFRGRQLEVPSSKELRGSIPMTGHPSFSVSTPARYEEEDPAAAAAAAAAKEQEKWK